MLISQDGEVVFNIMGQQHYYGDKLSSPRIYAFVEYALREDKLDSVFSRQPYKQDIILLIHGIRKLKLLK